MGDEGRGPRPRLIASIFVVEDRDDESTSTGCLMEIEADEDLGNGRPKQVGVRMVRTIGMSRQVINWGAKT